MYTADIRHENPVLAEKLAHIFTLRGGPMIDLSIRPAYLALLARLGNPHLNLPPVIHVAGTNGKGSTIAMLRAVLHAAGYRVHAYTSPHLIRFNERIVIAGAEIDDETLESLLDTVMAAPEARELTFFEITTAIAFMAFAGSKADFTLLETGLGGRLDCTNVVPAPAVTAITAIGHDHNEFLGDTLAAIAGEKAGIIKAGRPLITGPITDHDAAQTIAAKAAQENAPLYRAGQEYHATILPPAYDGGGLQFEIAGKRIKYPIPSLHGAHQGANAGIVLAILHALEQEDYLFDHFAIGEGLTQARWPARLQHIEKGALLAALPAGSTLWIDGGHNEDAGAVLAAQAKLWNKQGDRPLIAITAMMATKRADAFMAHLAPHCAQIIAIPMPHDDHGHPPAHLTAAAREAGATHTHEAAHLQDALAHIAAQNINARVLICGSLYLAGEALRLNSAV